MTTVWDINPEPWRTVGVARHGPPAKDGKLVAYQDALRDELEGCAPYWADDVRLSVTFYFWRSTAHGQPCDLTNLQKSTEDALQGVLYHNDKGNHHVQSYLMEQGPDVRPCIVIKVRLFEPPAWISVDIDPPPEAPKLFEDVDWQAPEGDEF